MENTVEDLQKARGRLEDMEGQLTELNERLEDEEDNNAEITAVKHKLEDEIEDLKQEISELGTALDKVRFRLSCTLKYVQQKRLNCLLQFVVKYFRPNKKKQLVNKTSIALTMKSPNKTLLLRN